jgi:hypothetical protein
MSFQYVSSMCRPLGRNQAANVDPSAETLSRGHRLARVLDWPDASTLDHEVVGESRSSPTSALTAMRRGARGCTCRPRHRANIFVDLSRRDSGLRLDAGGC